MHTYLFLALVFTMVNFIYAQLGVFGCMSAFNTDIHCPRNRTFEITIWTGEDDGANSDSLDITASFFDARKNPISILPLKWPNNCNPYEKGSVDVFKGCANWVEIVKSVSFTIEKSDQMQVKALTVTLGDNSVFQTQFWFSDKANGTYMGWPVFSKLDLPISIKK
jgi:hypothetical protein